MPVVALIQPFMMAPGGGGSPIPPSVLDTAIFRPFSASGTSQPTVQSYTVPANTESLILMACISSGSGWVLSGVGWDMGSDGSPQAFTKIDGQIQGINEASAWRLHAPDVGAGELEITISGGTIGTTMAFLVVALDGVDTGAAIVSAKSGGTGSQPAQLAIDPPDPAAIILHLVNTDDTGHTVSSWNGATQMDAGDYDTAGGQFAARKDSADGAATTVELDLDTTSSAWAQVAVAVKGEAA